MGKELPNIAGGFGGDKRSMLAQDIADFHDKETWKVNRAINNNSRRFKRGIDVINIKENNLVRDLIESGFLSQPQVNASDSIYLLSEKGYMILNQIVEESSIAKKVLVEYFKSDIKEFALIANRKEIMFKLSVEEVLEDICNVLSQYYVKGYFIDIYLPEYNLAIEFDEEYHKNQQKEDLIRQDEIEEELGCKFIRVSEDEKLEIGLNKILKEVL